jgi:hypothetical protein
MSLSTMNWKRGLLRLWAVAAVFSSLSTISVVAASESFQTFVPKPNLNDCELMKAFDTPDAELPWFCKSGAPPYSVSASSGTIKLVSRQNNLIVEEISANRGNCPIAGAITSAGQRQPPFTLRFGNTLEIVTACVDAIIEVTVEGPSLGGVHWVPKN